ncbi:uncharacterized protein LOC120713472 [Panicum virgatum]|uniref:uncharacterized protein LOC120713472 n=1 Tax=Panicum virgatum TaxID=38727 RepID=UPI0019D69D99|nr:uncharacterized protein LOC120713472 [Panicum virgatum]
MKPKASSPAQSGYRGVRRRRSEPRRPGNRNRHRLGNFDTAEQSALADDQAAWRTAAAWTGAIAAGAADEADTSAAREEEAERGIAGDTAAATAADEAVRRQRTRSRRLGAGRGSQRPGL